MRTSGKLSNNCVLCKRLSEGSAASRLWTARTTVAVCKRNGEGSAAAFKRNSEGSAAARLCERRYGRPWLCVCETARDLRRRVRETAKDRRRRVFVDRMVQAAFVDRMVQAAFVDRMVQAAFVDRMVQAALC